MPDLKEFARKHLTWLGHDSFLIHAGKTIYIDPYQITDEAGRYRADHPRAF